MKGNALVNAFVRHLDELLGAEGLTLASDSAHETEWRGPLFEGNDAFLRVVFDANSDKRVRTRASVGLTSRFQAHLERSLRLWECLPAGTFDIEVRQQAQTITILDAWLEWLMVGGKLPIPRLEFDHDSHTHCAAVVANAVLLHGRVLWRRCTSPAMAVDLLQRLDEYPGENRNGAPTSSDRFLFAAVLHFLAGELPLAREELDLALRHEAAKANRLGLRKDAIEAYHCTVERVREYLDHPFALESAAYGLYTGNGRSSPVEQRRLLLGESESGSA